MCYTFIFIYSHLYVHIISNSVINFQPNCEDDLVVRHRSPVSIDNGYRPAMADEGDCVTPNSESKVKIQVNKNVSAVSKATQHYPTLYTLIKCSSFVLLLLLFFLEILFEKKTTELIFTPLLNTLHRYLYMFLH